MDIIASYIKHYQKLVVQYLWPNYCPVTNEELLDEFSFSINAKKQISFPKENICIYCQNKKDNVENELCAKCENKKIYFTSHITSFYYKEPIDELILKLKYGDRHDLVPFFAKFMAANLQKKNVDIDMITYIPSALNRYIERKYNQSLLLSKHVQKFMKRNYKKEIPLMHLLQRKGVSKSQAGLNYVKRSENLRDVFYFCSKKTSIKNKNILLIDDVFATGATLNEASRILKSEGCKNIYCLTIAAVNYDKDDENEKINSDLVL